MKALHEKVNIVPVLAKADCLTPMELARKKLQVSVVLNMYYYTFSVKHVTVKHVCYGTEHMKRGFFVIAALQIREEIETFGINIYQFPECDSDEDEEFKLQDQEHKVSIVKVIQQTF